MIPDISNLRIFGCIAYVHVPKEIQRKLDSKTVNCLFLGFDSETKAFHLFDPNRQKVIISHDVVFDESKVGFQHIGFGEPLGDFQIQLHTLKPTKPQILKLTDAEEHDTPPSAAERNSNTKHDDLPERTQPMTSETPLRTPQAPQPVDSQADPLVWCYPTHQR